MVIYAATLVQKRWHKASTATTYKLLAMSSSILASMNGITRAQLFSMSPGNTTTPYACDIIIVHELRLARFVFFRVNGNLPNISCTYIIDPSKFSEEPEF